MNFPRFSRHGPVRHGKAWQGVARHYVRSERHRCSIFMAWSGMAGHGLAGRGNTSAGTVSGTNFPSVTNPPHHEG